MDSWKALLQDVIEPAVRRFTEIYHPDELPYLPAIFAAVPSHVLTGQSVPQNAFREQLLSVPGLSFADHRDHTMHCVEALLSAALALHDNWEGRRVPDLERIKSAISQAAREFGASARDARGTAERFGPILYDQLRAAVASNSYENKPEQKTRVLRLEPSGDLTLDEASQHSFRGQDFLILAECFRTHAFHWADGYRLFKEWWGQGRRPNNPLRRIETSISRIRRVFRDLGVDLAIRPVKIGGNNSGLWKLHAPANLKLSGPIVEAQANACDAHEMLAQGRHRELEEKILDALHTDPDCLTAHLALGKLAHGWSSTTVSGDVLNRTIRYLRTAENGLTIATEELTQFATMHGNNKILNDVRARILRMTNEASDGRRALERIQPRDEGGTSEHALRDLDDIVLQMKGHESGASTGQDALWCRLLDDPTIQEITKTALERALTIVPAAKHDLHEDYASLAHAKLYEVVRHDAMLPSAQESLNALKDHWGPKLTERITVELIEWRWGMTKDRQRAARASAGQRATERERATGSSDYQILLQADKAGDLNLTNYWNLFRRGTPSR